MTDNALATGSPKPALSSPGRRWRNRVPIILLVICLLGVIAVPLVMHRRARDLRDARPASQSVQPRGLPPGEAGQGPTAPRATLKRTAEIRRIEQIELALLSGLGLAGVIAALWIAHLTRRLEMLNAKSRLRAQREAALRRAARSLSAAGDLPDVLQQIAASAIRVADAEGAIVEMVTSDRSEVEIRATAGERVPRLGTRLPYPGSLAEHVLSRGEPALVSPAAPEARSMVRYIDHSGEGSLVLAVPLVSERGALGVLTLTRESKSPPFTPEEIARTRTLADLASLALRRVLLLHSTERERRAKHALLESAGEGIYGIDPEGRCTFMNRAGAKILGYSVEEVLGKDMYRLVHRPPDDDVASGRESPLLSAQRSGRGIRVEDATLWRKDGTPFPAVYSSYPLIEEGEICGAVVSFADNTERKKVETALRESEQRFRLLYDDNPSMYLIMDTEGRIVSINRFGEEQLGFARDELIGQPALTTVFPPDGGVFLRHFFAAVRNAPSVQRTEIRRVRKDGSVLWVQETARATKDSQGRPIVLAVCEDITALREAEEERARLFLREQESRTSAEEAVRARDEVLGVVSHDLRNPVGTISMAASLLLDIPLPEEDRCRHLQVIRRSADRMNRLIQDLLDVSRLEGGRMAIDAQPLSARSIAQEASDVLMPLALERGVRLQSAVADGLPLVCGDRDRILQVLSNLVGNAIKFTPEGGEISLCVREGSGAVLFSVRDTGPGIDPEHLEHLFDRFWQADGTAHLGAGLGLAIARGIVEAHGGEIWVESTVGEGTTFYFTIPTVGA